MAVGFCPRPAAASPLLYAGGAGVSPVAIGGVAAFKHDVAASAYQLPLPRGIVDTGVPDPIYYLPLKDLNMKETRPFSR